MSTVKELIAWQRANVESIDPAKGIINVREYGAKGDGIQDDTAYIQQAVDRNSDGEGAVIWFPAGGTYKITGPIHMYDNTVIWGYGATLLAGTGFNAIGNGMLSNISGNYLSPTFTYTASKNISVYGLTFKSENKLSQAVQSYPFVIYSAAPAVFTGVHIQDVSIIDLYGGGILLFEARNVFVSNYTCTGYRTDGALAWGGGINFWGVQDAIIDNFIIKDSDTPGWHGVIVSEWDSGPENVIISNGLIQNVDGDGISCESPHFPGRNVSIDNVFIKDIPAHAIHVTGGPFYISNITMENVDYAIYADNGFRAEVYIDKLMVTNSNSTTNAVIHHNSGNDTSIWHIRNCRFQTISYRALDLFLFKELIIESLQILTVQDRAISIASNANARIIAMRDIEIVDPGQKGGVDYTININDDTAATHIEGVIIRFTGATKTNFGIGLWLQPKLLLKQVYMDACGTARYAVNRASLYSASQIDYQIESIENNVKIVRGSSAPASGNWDRGDTYYTTTPSAGGKIGSVCTASGAPGTWKPFGAIDA
ncbi:glycosyl hydrolase family 28-related protein [Paenibacillus sp. HJGM_3]|uniref:glycosyl hydrolase family 28-related protein n=1 Tax=Paenibacillus sp. HJGM_3 TaxID=3379816 RepID=UPI0038593981